MHSYDEMRYHLASMKDAANADLNEKIEADDPLKFRG
jgi:hypothetical protein